MAQGGKLVKTAVITGGAGGLGSALCDALLVRGWHVVILDLPGPALEKIEKKHNVSAYSVDLTDEVKLANTAEEIISARPSVDLVVYNAGITQIGLFDEASQAGHRKVFEINYFAAVSCARAFLQPLRNSKGVHLAISSVAGFSPLYKRTAYAASKHALEGFFNSLRSEEKTHGVATLIAAPSFVATNVGNPGDQGGGIARPGSATDSIDTMTADAAAAVILKGMDKRKPMIPVGRIATLSWIISRLSPKLFQKLMERQINR